MSTTTPDVALPSAEPRPTEVADGVFAFVQPRGGWCVSNSGLLVSGRSAALIDTAATESRARNLRRHVERVAPEPPSVLVNTHSHGDHTFGNFMFPEAVVVAHEQARREMAAAGLHLAELWPGVDFGAIEVTLPRLTYRDRLTVHVGELTAELVHPGVAHTVNDTIVWLPERRVLFTGDIVMSGVTPFCPLGSVSGSLQAIAALREFGADTVVTGHGPVGGPEVFDVAERYLRWVRDLAAAGVAADVTPLDVAREAELGEFAELVDPERLVPNLHRAFAEERSATLGTELDIAAMAKEMGIIFGEMVTYRGGPLRCEA